MNCYLPLLVLSSLSLLNLPEAKYEPTLSEISPVILQDQTGQEVKMEIKGLYEHRNLFISNPLLANGKRCITKAPELNGIPTAKVTDTNVLEIKLSEYELELGEVIQLVIWHSPDCTPVVVNPEVIDPSN